MRVKVNQALCQGHSLCYMTVPHVFKLDDDGHAYAEEPDVSAADTASVRNAADACPEMAIEVEAEPDGD